MKQQTVIFIGKADGIKLGLIRCVGEYGYKVIDIYVINSGKPKVKPVDYYSKYVSSYHFVKLKDLVRFLIEKCSEQGQKPILFPLDDKSVRLIDLSADELGNYFLFSRANNQYGGISNLMDKSLQKELAYQNGFNVAKGWVIPFVNGKYDVPDDIEFPCFLKGQNSYNSSKKFQKKCTNYEELHIFLNECLSNNPCSLLAEEYIEIDKEIGYIALSDGEKNIIPAEVELIEIGKGTTHGVSYLGRINPLMENDELLTIIEKFIQKIGYIGICNFDFIYSHGTIYFSEVNFRFAAYAFGICKAGVNLPVLYINSLVGINDNKLETSLHHNAYYFNEKIGLYNVLERFISWSEYKSLKKKSDYLMVKCKKDPKPYRFFLLTMGLKFLKKKLHL